MPHNLLVTGPPRSGKTTTVELVEVTEENRDDLPERLAARLPAWLA